MSNIHSLQLEGEDHAKACSRKALEEASAAIDSMDHLDLQRILTKAVETDPATRDLVNAMTYSIERTKDPKYLTSEQITSDLHTRASRGPAAQRNIEAQLIAETLLLYSRTLLQQYTECPNTKSRAKALFTLCDIGHAVASAPKDTHGYIARKNFDGQSGIVFHIRQIFKEMTPSEKSYMLSESSDPRSFISKLSELECLTRGKRLFSDLPRALDDLKNPSRAEVEDETRSYPCNDWNLFPKFIGETGFDFDRLFRSSWVRLTMDLNRPMDAFEISDTSCKSEEHVKDIIRAINVQCIEHPTQETLYNAISTLCKIGKTIALLSPDPLHVATRKRFERSPFLENALSAIVAEMKPHHIVMFFKEKNDPDALGPRLREVEMLGRQHELFGGLGRLLDEMLDLV